MSPRGAAWAFDETKNMKTKLSFLLLAAALIEITGNFAFALTVPVAQETYSNRAGELTSADGKAAELTVSDNQIALLEFDIQNMDVVPTTIIPGNIASAILELYVIKTNAAATLNVLAVTGTWSETFVAAHEPLPSIASTVLGTIPVTKVPYKQFVSVDITPAVVAALASGSNLSLAIETSTPGAIVTLGSKDGPASGYAAVLDIEAGLGGINISGSDIAAGSVTGAQLAPGAVPNLSQVALLKWAPYSNRTVAVPGNAVGICFDGANIWVADDGGTVSKL